MAKYNHIESNIPQDRRQEINDKIVSLIYTGNMQGITPEVVYNSYTGKGSLHGLNRKDFKSYYAYSTAKKEIEDGQFFTPAKLCEDIIQSIRPDFNHVVCDPTSGMGSYFNFLPNENNIYGNEIESNAHIVAKFLYPKAKIENKDLAMYRPPVLCDLIFGNPPFNTEICRINSQHYFTLKCAEYLKPGGLLISIYPDSYLADEFTDKYKIDEVNELYDFICQSKVPSKGFGVGIGLKVMWLRKRFEGEGKPYNGKYVQFQPEDIYNKYIKLIHDDNAKNKSKIFLQVARNQSNDFLQKSRKLLYDIKQHPKTKEFYSQALQLVHELETQTCPDGIKYNDWVEIMLTPEKVLAGLREILMKQNAKVPEYILKWVKRNYGVKLKAYADELKPKEEVIGNATLYRNEFLPIGFEKLYKKKYKKFNTAIAPIEEMKEQPSITKFINDFTLMPTEIFEPVIKLNDKQKNDLKLTFQKDYSILNWQQGSGKTIAGLAWMQYQKNNVQKIFLLAPALAVSLTWEVFLERYGFKYDRIKTISDVYKSKNQIVLLSFNKLVDLKRHIKKLCRLHSYKIGLLVDESDEMTNQNSERTMAAIACFKKAKAKLLTTGTTTRNNINELYPQLELLYNNSNNMTCWCNNIYRTDKKTNDMIQSNNPFWSEPFPAREGLKLFKECFSPHKVTVFGINKDTQDIYNPDDLKQIIKQTIITRKFEDIAGEKKYEVKTHRIFQNSFEGDLYSKIMKEFHFIIDSYYTSTGNSRKDAMLRIIRQLQLLIKSTSIPHLMPHYEGDMLPNKFHHAFSLIEGWNEKVAIGTVFVDAAKSYVVELQNRFPDREVFYIDGVKSFKKRKEIIHDFQTSTNGILVSTQQSLKSSVNIPTCNKVIIEALQWNLPKISQYYFRFIRFDSTEPKEVHFITYQRTIEQNLLALLLDKERLNEFIKTMDFASRDEMFSELDVDISILLDLITKDTDADGKVQLNWGNAKLIA